MNCPKHLSQKMTLLFTSYVCDVCDPPRGAAAAPPPSRRSPDGKFALDTDDCVLCPECGERCWWADRSAVACKKEHYTDWTPWEGAVIIDNSRRHTWDNAVGYWRSIAV